MTEIGRSPDAAERRQLSQRNSLGLDFDRGGFLSIVKTAFRNWRAIDGTFRAAALAYFMVMPLPSLLVIIAAILAEIYGQKQGSALLMQQIESVAGPTISQLVGELLSSAGSPLGSALGFFLIVVFVVWGAIGAFIVLQDSMNLVWGVKLPGHTSLREMLQKRILPFLLVSGLTTLVIAFSGLMILLLNSIDTGLRNVFGILDSYFSLGASLLVSFGLAVALFAIVYRQVPDTRIAWRDVSMAAVVSAVIFTLLNNLFGIYLHAFPVTTVAGAAGSLILLLLWVFVINACVLFGAEFSRVYAETLGSRARPIQPELKTERATRPVIDVAIASAFILLWLNSLRVDRKRRKTSH